MFISYGTRRNDKRLGYVADFCPVCRDMQSCALYCLRMAFYLYWLNIGPGRPVGYAIVCRKCGLWQMANPDRYVSVQVATPDGLMPLTEATLPNVSELYGDRLRLEQQISGGSAELSHEERQRLLQESLIAVAEHHKLAARSGTSLPTILVVAGIMFQCIQYYLPPAVHLSSGLSDSVLLGSVVLAAIFWIANRIQRIAAANDLLVISLLPLHPSSAEISKAMAGVDIADKSAWDQLKPETVELWISQVQAVKDTAALKSREPIGLPGRDQTQNNDGAR